MAQVKTIEERINELLNIEIAVHPMSSNICYENMISHPFEHKILHTFSNGVEIVDFKNLKIKYIKISDPLFSLLNQETKSKIDDEEDISIELEYHYLFPNNVQEGVLAHTFILPTNKHYRE